jgi:malate/lactate dehydrogenase
MGVITDGTFYDIPKDLCFSLPVICRDFKIEIVKDLELDDFSKEKIKTTTQELIKEKELAKSLEDHI